VLSEAAVRGDIARIVTAIQRRDDAKLQTWLNATSEGAEYRNALLGLMRRTSTIAVSQEGLDPVVLADGRASAHFRLKLRWSAFGSVLERHPEFSATWRRDGESWTLESLAVLSKVQ
jgi:hypothetical protein